MGNYDFTKSFIRESNKQVKNPFNNRVNELNKLKRISDNMNGINPFTKERMVNEPKKEILKNDSDLTSRINAIKNINKD